MSDLMLNTSVFTIPDEMKAFKRPDACDRCDLCKESINQSGNFVTCFMGEPPYNPDRDEFPLEDVDIMVIGDYPNKIDIDNGYTYMGVTGELLESICDKAGFNLKQEAYVTFAVKCSPTISKSVTPTQTARCRKYLEQEIQRIKPKVIVTMGQYSFLSVMAFTEDNMLTAESKSAYNLCLNADWEEFCATNSSQVFDKYVKSKDRKKYFPTPNLIRGSVFWSEEFRCYVVPTFNPEVCIPSKTRQEEVISRDGKVFCMMHDFQLATDYDELYNRTFNKVKKDYKVVKTAYQAEKFFKFLLSLKTPVAVDIETSGLDFTEDDILCASFSWDIGKSVVVPLKGCIDSDSPHYETAKKGKKTPVPDIWNPSEYKTILFFMKRFLESEVPKVLQNGKFDIKFFMKHGIQVNNFIFDTLLAHHLINENLPHNLEFLAIWYTDMGRYDLDLESWKPNKHCNYSIIPTSILYPYVCSDTDATIRIYKILDEELRKDSKLNEIFYVQSMPLQSAFTDIEYAGVRIDVDELNSVHKKLNVAIKRIRDDIVTEYTPIYKDYLHRKNVKKWDVNFNPDSNTQLSIMLFEILNLTPPKLTKGGAYSVEKSVIDSLSSIHSLPEKVAILRRVTKLNNTYVKGSSGNKETGIGSLVDKDEYIHTSYLIHGTVSGRTSSRSPNLQNIPNINIIKNLFIPKDGYVFVEADYKAAEVRVLGVVSKDEKLIQRLQKGKDIHTETASDLFNIPLHEMEQMVKENSKCYERKVAKNTLFGVIYGESAMSLAPKLDISVEKAQEFIDKLFDTYPKMKKIIKSYQTLAYRGKPIINLFGRHRRLLGDIYTPKMGFKSKFGEIMRQAVNSPIQATASDITLRSLIKMHEILKGGNYDCRIVLTIHDSIIFEVRNTQEEKKKLYDLIEREMIFNFKNSPVIFYVDVNEQEKWMCEESPKEKEFFEKIFT